MLDARKAYCMGPCGACCHPLKRRIREAALAFKKGICLFGLLLIQDIRKLDIDCLLGLESLIKDRL